MNIHYSQTLVFKKYLFENHVHTLTKLSFYSGPKDMADPVSAMGLQNKYKCYFYFSIWNVTNFWCCHYWWTSQIKDTILEPNRYLSVLKMHVFKYFILKSYFSWMNKARKGLIIWFHFISTSSLVNVYTRLYNLTNRDFHNLEAHLIKVS